MNQDRIATSIERSNGQKEADSDSDDVVEAAGHFRIYLGAAAGVGKTFSMLNEGQRRSARGADVVIGFVECHGRKLTQDCIRDLELVPRVAVGYRGTSFEEMDLQAVLKRRPEVVLVDELAHTNVPGSGSHEKRWQDVVDLLDAGIDVITTVNIQHLESIADAVERMTDTQVRERVPDWVVRKADQIELVDSSPEQLRRRLLHGHIYPADKVPQSLTHFFRTDNLIALRELSLRFLADETEEDLLEHLKRHQADHLWETTERIMAGVTSAPDTEAIIRRAARMAARLKAHLYVVHVESSDALLKEGDRLRLESLQQLAMDVGAEWHDVKADEPGSALLAFAREHQITQVVLGASKRSRWQELVGGGSIVRSIERAASAEGIDVHIIARSELPLDPDGAT